MNECVLRLYTQLRVSGTSMCLSYCIYKRKKVTKPKPELCPPNCQKGPLGPSTLVRFQIICQAVEVYHLLSADPLSNCWGHHWIIESSVEIIATQLCNWSLELLVKFFALGDKTTVVAHQVEGILVDCNAVVRAVRTIRSANPM